MWTKLIEKEKSIALRRQGYSVKEIAEKLLVAKGSVSTWVRNVKLTQKQKLKLKKNIHSPLVIEKRRNSRLLNETTKRNLIINEAAKTIQKLDKETLRILGTGLYWGEGAKTYRGMLRLSNSDPAVIMMTMRYFREVCGVEDHRFHAQIHIHSVEAVAKAEEYWSKITGIPKSQFYKTYAIKSKSSKNIRTTIPLGTINVGVCDTKLLLRTLGWIEGFKRQVQ